MTVFSARTEVENLAAAQVGFAHVLNQYATQPTLLLVSGGSALSLFDRSDLFSGDASNMFITVLDERFDPQHSNFAALSSRPLFKTLVDRGASSGNPFTHKNSDTMGGVAEYMHTTITDWYSRNPHGHSIATFGIGHDGHTAGIFPDNEDRAWFRQYTETDKLYIAIDVGSRNPHRYRITATPRCIQKVMDGIVFVTGKEKGPILKQFIDETVPHRIPAVYIKSVPRVCIYTDATVVA